VALEPAQLLAGVVRYPEPTPFLLYETNVWNVWHQLLAPLLAVGVPERALSIALSGAVTALTFAALAGFALALGANAALALATPFLVLLVGAAQNGFGYPILLLGYGHIYGTAGLSWLALACALLAAERWRAAGLVLGLSPAFHASLGPWLGIALGLAALSKPAALRPHARALATGALLGAALAGASLLAHAWGRPPSPVLDPAEADRYFDGFLRVWDAHRLTAELGSWVALAAGAGTLVAAALVRAGAAPRVGADLALRVLVVHGAVGLLAALLPLAAPLESIPRLLLIAMPTRLANLVILLFVPLLVGTLWRQRRDPLARAVLLALVAVLALGLGWLEWGSHVDLQAWPRPLLGIAALAVVARGGRFAPGRLRGAAPPEPPGRLRILDGALTVSLAGIVLWMLAVSLAGAGTRARALGDRTNRHVLAAAAQDRGLLLLGPGLEWIQLRTRRPLLLDPSALDILPYALAAGPDMEAILREAYGVDFFQPPAGALHTARIPVEPVKTLWQGRSEEEWRAVRARFRASEVLVASDWRLRLPELARGAGFALYRLPE
jgi:hypothetical protein